VRERAVALYLNSKPRPPITRLADQLGVHPDALRYWIKKATAERSADHQLGVDNAAAEVGRLQKENAQLRRAVELLKTANVLLADQLDPTTLRA